MTGRSRFGKISTRVRMIANTDPSASATTRTMMAMGRRRAIRISHINATSLSPGLAVVVETAADHLARQRPQVRLSRLPDGQLHHRPRPAQALPRQRRRPPRWLNQIDIARVAVVRLPEPP